MVIHQYQFDMCCWVSEETKSVFWTKSPLVFVSLEVIQMLFACLVVCLHSLDWQIRSMSFRFISKRKLKPNINRTDSKSVPSFHQSEWDACFATTIICKINDCPLRIQCIPAQTRTGIEHLSGWTTWAKRFRSFRRDHRWKFVRWIQPSIHELRLHVQWYRATFCFW